MIVPCAGGADPAYGHFFDGEPLTAPHLSWEILNRPEARIQSLLVC